MSIINGLFAGRSGISSHGAAIAVVGDNISNSSTVGYKASRAEFEDLIAGGGGAGRTIGSGASLAAVTTPFTQGTLEFTNRSLDLAIDGNGMFAVQDGEQRFYTRAGNFQVNAGGDIVDQNGYSVLGYSATGTGALETLNVNSVSSSSAATTTVSIAANLDARSAEVALANGLQFQAGGAYASPVPFDTLGTDAAFQTTVDVVDSLGASHQLSLYFFKNDNPLDNREWGVGIYAEGSEITGGTAGEAELLGYGLFSFPSNGSLGAAPTLNQLVTDIQWTNGSDQTQDIDFSLDPLTQFASASQVSAVTQDGRGVGAVTGVSIDTDGTVSATLDNGDFAILGTVGLVNFANPEGLQRVGGNLYVQSNASGEPIAGAPGAGTFGDIQSGSLELSTTDIATEFVKLITLQRGFQASSRIITTINQLLNEVIQLA